MVLFIIAAFTAAVYAEQSVKAAKADFKQARKTYILAKEELVDAKFDSLLTLGYAEKNEAVERMQKARKELKSANKAYKAALKKLHMAEIARDAKIERFPWSDFSK
jgi:Holliday junction resolvasome RuvABC DNA-binding subunit